MQHDPSYKLLFSNPAMVEDLLRGFVHEEWLGLVDFSTLEIEKGDFVSDQLVQRTDDVVWRVKFRDEWLYVYLAIEFQSTVDPFMALRMMVYVGLLYQHLERGGKLTRNGRLPPVLPLVLYNGEARWTAPLEISELIESGPTRDLLRYRPQFHYLLLDEVRLAESDLSGMKNLAAALFRLETSRGPEDIRQVLACLIDWLREPAQRTLRRAFAVWMRRVLLPARIPGVELEEFGVEAKLAQASTDQLERWADRILDAESLEAVFRES